MNDLADESTHGVVGAAHPMLAGHFPGHPIVPGAWLLGWVVAAAERHCPARKVVGVRRVKFLRPLAPDQAFACALRVRAPAQAAADTLRFTVTHESAVIAEGSLQLQSQQHD